MQIKLGIIQRVLTDYRLAFFEALAKTNIAVSVFAGDPQRHEGIPISGGCCRIPYFHANNLYIKTPLGPVVWQRGIKQWLEDFDPDVVVLERNPRILSNWLACLRLRKNRRAIVGWGLGNLWDQQHKSFLLDVLRRYEARFFLRMCDCVLAYSSKGAEDYISMGMPPEKVVVVPNATDTNEANSLYEELTSDFSWIPAWRHKFGLAPERPIILFVGRLIKEKEIDTLIRVVNSLRSASQLLIVGDGPYRGELERLAAGNDSIHFAGHQTGSPLAKCYLGSSLFVLPGAGGLGIHQAMSFAKPIVVSASGDGTELDLVLDGINGVFFRPGDEADLQTKLIEMLSNASQLKTMGEASLERIRRHASMDQMLSAFLLAVRSVCHDVDND